MLKQYKFWIFINLFIVEIDTQNAAKIFCEVTAKKQWLYILKCHSFIGGSFLEELQS